MSEHTKGPIYVDVRTGVAVLSTKPTPNCLDGECDGEILRIHGNGESAGVYRLVTAEQEANIRLWAAAPDLLAALKWAMSYISPPTRRIAGQNESYCDGYEHATKTLAAADNRATIHSAGGK